MRPQGRTCPTQSITRLVSSFNVCFSHVATCEKLLGATCMEWGQHCIVVAFKCVDNLFPCITLANNSAIQIPFSRHHSQQYPYCMYFVGFFHGWAYLVLTSSSCLSFGCLWLIPGRSRQSSLFVESIFHVGLASDSIMESELATLCLQPSSLWNSSCMAVVYWH